MITAVSVFYRPAHCRYVLLRCYKATLATYLTMAHRANSIFVLQYKNFKFIINFTAMHHDQLGYVMSKLQECM